MANFIKVHLKEVDVLLIVSNIIYIKKIEKGCEIMMVGEEKTSYVDNTFEDIEAQLKS